MSAEVVPRHAMWIHIQSTSRFDVDPCKLRKATQVCIIDVFGHTIRTHGQRCSVPGKAVPTLSGVLAQLAWFWRCMRAAMHDPPATGCMHWHRRTDRTDTDRSRGPQIAAPASGRCHFTWPARAGKCLLALHTRT